MEKEIEERIDELERAMVEYCDRVSQLIRENIYLRKKIEVLEKKNTERTVLDTKMTEEI